MTLHNANIIYTVRINVGTQKDTLIEIEFDLENLQENTLSDYLVENEHLDFWKNNGEYDVIGRKIELI
jgi:hypothetical protein